MLQNNQYAFIAEALDASDNLTMVGTRAVMKSFKDTGIDIAEEAILYAREHYPGMVFMLGDMCSIPVPPDSFDIVVCMEGFEHVSKKTGVLFLPEVLRILKEDGVLVMSCPVLLPGDVHSGNPYHLYEPLAEALHSVLAIGFETIYSEHISGPDGHILYFVGARK